MDRKEAFKILELDENSTSKEIDEKYMIHFKRFKNRNIDDENANEKWELIKKAYDFFNNDKKEVKKKLSLIDYIYYYKNISIIIVIALAVIGYTVYESLNKFEPEVKVSIVGDFNGPIKYLNNWIISDVKISNPYIEMLRIDDKSLSQENMASITKSHLQFQSKEVDLYIFDKGYYDKMSSIGLVELSSILKPEIIEIYGVKNKNDKVFGIDLKYLNFDKRFKIDGKDFIMSLRDNSKNQNTAKEILNKILEIK